MPTGFTWSDIQGATGMVKISVSRAHPFGHRIDARALRDLRYWTRQHGVGERDLRLSVQTVGPSLHNIRNL